MFHSLQTFALPGTSSNGFSVWQRGQGEGSEPQLHRPHYKPHVRFTFLRLLSAAAATRSVSSPFRRTLQHVFFKLVRITSLLCNRLQSRKHNVELYNLPPGGRTQHRVGCFFCFFVLLLWMSNSLKHTSTRSKPTSLHLARCSNSQTNVLAIAVIMGKIEINHRGPPCVSRKQISVLCHARRF